MYCPNGYGRRRAICQRKRDQKCISATRMNRRGVTRNPGSIRNREKIFSSSLSVLACLCLNLEALGPYNKREKGVIEINEND